MNDLNHLFQLRQQTPHLHFLHRQPGPALRLTELKAKLDRLIARHVFQDDFNRASTYLVGYRSSKPDALKSKWDNEYFRAFDYRLRLELKGGKEEMWVVSTPSAKFAKAIKNESNDDFLGETPYFADNDKTDLYSEDLKKGVLYAQDIGLRVFSLYSELVDHVREYLPLLLAVENFGCRQSKGFGCYWLKEHSFEEQLKKAAKKEIISGVWVSNKRSYRDDEIDLVFRQIATDYRILKSGFNHPMDASKYRKSLLFEYFANGGNVRWEKRKIKQEINKVRPGALRYTREPLDHQGGRDANGWGDPPGANYDYRYIRALLGLAEQFEFQSSSPEKIKVKISHPEIERFRSPITIKVVGGKIYWLALAKPYDKIQGKTFEFSAEQANSPIFRNQPIAVPTGFDLNAFLNAKIGAVGYQPLSL